MKIINFLALALLLSFVKLQAAPAPFTYQGQLSDTNGPVTGTFDFSCSIHDALVGPPVNGTLPVNVNSVAVSNGLFTVVLDFGDTTFDGSTRYLQIQLRSADAPNQFTALSPRQPLTATPYATFATRAGSISNNSITPSQLATAGPPQPGQTLTFSGGQLVWATPTANTNTWRLGGNEGTVPGQNFIGTLDARALELRVNNARILKLEPTTDTPNFLGGFSGNNAQSNLAGVTISGGGTAIGDQPNVAVNNARYSTISGGYSNVVAAYGARIGGGSTHRASGSFSSIDGGQFHVASGNYTAIGGGYNNTANGETSAIGGGLRNGATNDYAAIAGGADNRAGGYAASIGGGVQNHADGNHATIAGGAVSVAPGHYSAIGGGRENTAATGYSTVGGGAYNQATGLSSTVGGGYQNEAPGQDTFVGGGLANVAFGLRSGVAFGAYNNAMGQYAAVSGGQSNVAVGDWTAVGGGALNRADGKCSVVTGGFSNNVNGVLYSTIDGGLDNLIDHGIANSIVAGEANQLLPGSAWSGIVGGVRNVISTNVNASTILGGYWNEIAPDAQTAAILAGAFNQVNGGSQSSAIIGGSFSSLIGNNSTLLAGVQSFVIGSNSVGAGYRTGIGHNHCFAWGDGRDDLDEAATTGPNQFVVRATGGVRFSEHTAVGFGARTRQMLNLWSTNYGIGVQAGTLYFRSDDDLPNNGFAWYLGGSHHDGFYNGGGGQTLMTLNSSGLSVNGTFVSLSDRNAKTNIARIEPKAVLEALDRVPVQTWSYKTDHGTTHIGPMAQDFHAAFRVGADDTTIATVDADGVALASIQALHQLLKERDERLQALERRLSDLEARLGSLR
jgi:hypothetical protein